MIIDSRGSLVWFDQLPPPLVAANFRPQRFARTQGAHLVAGPRHAVRRSGIGEGVIADTSLPHAPHRQAPATATAPTSTSSRSPRPGTRSSRRTRRSMVHLPGTPAGKLTADARLDRPGGRHPDRARRLGVARVRAHPARRLLRHAREQLRLRRLPRQLDRALEPHNRLLVSARDTSAVYAIDRATGTIDWTLGGKASSFALRSRRALLASSTTPTCSPANRISLFDDEAGPPFKAPSSRGLILALDLRHRTARRRAAVPPPRATHPAAERGQRAAAPERQRVRRLRLDRVLLRVLADRHARVRREPARRTTAATASTGSRGARRRRRGPTSAARKRTAGSGVDVYASWNGATTVARWQVLAGAERRLAHAVDDRPRHGFETHIAVSSARAAVSPSRRSTRAARCWPTAERSSLRDAETRRALIAVAVTLAVIAAPADERRRRQRSGIHKIRHVCDHAGEPVVRQLLRHVPRRRRNPDAATGCRRSVRAGSAAPPLRQARTTTPRTSTTAARTSRTRTRPTTTTARWTASSGRASRAPT